VSILFLRVLKKDLKKAFNLLTISFFYYKIYASKYQSHMPIKNPILNAVFRKIRYNQQQVNPFFLINLVIVKLRYILLSGKT
jgi:hypothetical protein